MTTTPNQIEAAKKIVGHEGCPYYMDDNHFCLGCLGCQKVGTAANFLAARDAEKDKVIAELRKESARFESLAAHRGLFIAEDGSGTKQREHIIEVERKRAEQAEAVLDARDAERDAQAEWMEADRDNWRIEAQGKDREIAELRKEWDIDHAMMKARAERAEAALAEVVREFDKTCGAQAYMIREADAKISRAEAALAAMTQCRDEWIEDARRRAHSEADLKSELAAMTTDRNEWKQSTLDGNTRFKDAEAKIAELRKKIEYGADCPCSGVKHHLTKCLYFRAEQAEAALAAMTKERDHWENHATGYFADLKKILDKAGVPYYSHYLDGVNHIVRELAALRAPVGDEEERKAENCLHAHADDCDCRKVLARSLRATKASLREAEAWKRMVLEYQAEECGLCAQGGHDEDVCDCPSLTRKINVLAAQEKK